MAKQSSLGGEEDYSGRQLIPRVGTVDFQEPVAKRRKREEPQRRRLDQPKTWLKGSVARASTPYDDGEREVSPTPDARKRVKVISKVIDVHEWRLREGHLSETGYSEGHEHKHGSSSRRGLRPIENHRAGSEQQAARQQETLMVEQVSTRQAKSQGSPRRLAPYVSAVVEKASSKFAASQKNHSPRPSPRAGASPTHQPEMRYRYVRNVSTSPSDRSGAPFVDAPEEIFNREPTGSQSSISSSGSSAFAEALNAAQAKADSAGRTQSPVLTPKFGAEIKRLSFTTSGRPMIRTSRPSSRAGPYIIDPVLLKGSNEQPSKPTSFTKHPLKTPNKPTSLSEQSSRLSEKQTTSGDHFRETLPEAQVVPDAPAPAVPSGPSTNLLETEKQSPKLPRTEEADSYMNLSTQAAIIKAQRSFQHDVLRNLNDSIEKKKPKSALVFAGQAGGINTTPVANNGHQRTRTDDSPPVKTEQLKEEPMSTQAMIDEMSPFAITTIKKRPTSPNLPRKRASFALSPTETRKAQQPEPSSLPSPISPGTPPTGRRYHERSMSTSSSDRDHSRIPSPLDQSTDPTRAQLSRRQSTAKGPPSSGFTSLSILPNGTIPTETQWGQDGQIMPHIHSPPPPPPPTLPEPDWDDGEDDDNVSLPLNHPFHSMPHDEAGGSLHDGVHLQESQDHHQQLSRCWHDFSSSSNNSWERRQGATADDLEGAIADAGKFLGQWDVEAEARKEGGMERNRGVASSQRKEKWKGKDSVGVGV